MHWLPVRLLAFSKQLRQELRLPLRHLRLQPQLPHLLRRILAQQRQLHSKRGLQCQQQLCDLSFRIRPQCRTLQSMHCNRLSELRLCHSQSL